MEVSCKGPCAVDGDGLDALAGEAEARRRCREGSDSSRTHSSWRRAHAIADRAHRDVEAEGSIAAVGWRCARKEGGVLCEGRTAVGVLRTRWRRRLTQSRCALAEEAGGWCVAGGGRWWAAAGGVAVPWTRWSSDGRPAGWCCDGGRKAEAWCREAVAEVNEVLPVGAARCGGRTSVARGV